MPLTKLASEILLQILSDKSLEFSDLCNVMLSCKRLSELSLVLLYKDLKFYCQTPRSDTRLDQLSASLERRPDRAQYVKSLDVSWRSIDSLIFTKISELLQQLPSLIRVKITEKDLLSPLISVFRSQRREEGDMTPADIIICSASAQSLRSVTIDDDKITCSDIVNIFKLSNLEAVTISNFNSQLHREPNFDFAQKESWGESRIKEFKVLKSSPPSGELVRYMLAGHPALEKLTWDVSYKLIGDLSPSGMMVALSAVKDHICEIDLSMPFYYQEKETCLDFSEFPHLRKLKTHDRLFFPFNSTRDKDPFLYYQSRPLSRLLPPNLGSLEVSNLSFCQHSSL